MYHKSFYILDHGGVTNRISVLQWEWYIWEQPTLCNKKSEFEGTPPSMDRFVGLVVKASASKAEDPRFESRLRRDFSGIESYQ